MLILSSVVGCFFPAFAEDFVIEVSKPIFVLPQFTGAFREREASIAPDEYETAERLKALLENQEEDKVLKELEGYYDIEISPAIQTLKAQIYFSLSQYDLAEKTYLSVLKRMPQLVRAHSDLGQLYLLTKNEKKARYHFARAIEYGSNDAIIHGQLAYLNLSHFGPFSAISEYQQAMALEPENMQWQQGLLAALSKAKMYDAAAALLSEILERNPLNSSLWLSQATLALQQDNTMKALAALEVAIALGDKSELNIRTAAKLHLQIKSYDRASELFEDHLKNIDYKMDTVNEYLIWMGQAGLWAAADKILTGFTPFIQNKNLDDQSQYYFHRARVANALKKVDEAEAFYQKALQLNPSNGDALLGLAKLYAKNADQVQAELLYIRAEALSSSEKDAMLGRAQLYIDMADYSSALLHLQNAHQKFPDLFDLKDNIQTLQNIIQSKSVR